MHDNGLSQQMKKHLHIINWAADYLGSIGKSLLGPAKVIQETPWSNVIQLPTLCGYYYLKQPAPLLAKEASVIRILERQFNVNVPFVEAINDELHCFIMKDAGVTLRHYINEENKSGLLCQAIKEFTAFQRVIESSLHSFLKLGLPDWRLHQLLNSYKEIINDKEFLKADGVTNQELDKLKNLTPLIAEQLQELSKYDIPETVVQPDFNTNNILINPQTKQLTIIDLGELAISHPFFSLHNFLFTTLTHHDVHEQDPIWKKMVKTSIKSWSDLWPQKKLLAGYALSKKLWPIYFVCVNYHFMHSVDLQALNSWYVNKPNRLANTFRLYMTSNNIS